MSIAITNAGMRRKVGVVGCVASGPGIICQKVGNYEYEVLVSIICIGRAFYLLISAKLDCSYVGLVVGVVFDRAFVNSLEDLNLECDEVKLLIPLCLVVAAAANNSLSIVKLILNVIILGPEKFGLGADKNDPLIMQNLDRPSPPPPPPPPPSLSSP